MTEGRLCEVPGCEELTTWSILCATHHSQYLIRRRCTIKPDGCWLWTGSTDRAGYGLVSIEGRPMRAHRWAWETLRGPIPAGLTIDHLCRVRHCVNPEHLEPVTTAENVKRAYNASMWEI